MSIVGVEKREVFLPQYFYALNKNRVKIRDKYEN